MNRFDRLLAFALFSPSQYPPSCRPAAATPAPKAAAQTVHISHFTFEPQVLTVRVGQTVTWSNDDDIPHAVVAIDRYFKSKVLETGEILFFTFATPGLVPYFCSLHPHMTGKVMVLK